MYGRRNTPAKEHILPSLLTAATTSSTPGHHRDYITDHLTSRGTDRETDRGVNTNTVKLQVTKRVERPGDKENSTIDSVNQGIVLCRHVTATYYHVIVIYRYLLSFASTATTRAEACLAKTKYSQCLNKPTQEHEAQNPKPVTAKPTDLTSSCGETRKTVDTKDQYAIQRVRGAYIATVC